MSCDPNDLIRSAQCLLQCIPPGSQLPAQTAMLDLINGGPTPTNTLIENAKQFIFRVPPRMQVPLQIYLLLVSLEGTGRTVDELLRSASCMRCIPRGFLPPVQTNEYCQWSEGGTGGCDNPIVLDWLQRMADDGVTLPSDDTIRAVCDFCNDLDLYGLTDQMLVVNPVIPDSFAAMQYPLIYQVGNGLSPFSNATFVTADLDENGILGDGITKYMATGFNPSTHWGLDLTSSGLSVYESDFSSGVNPEIELGALSEADNSMLALSAFDPTLGDGQSVGWHDGSSNCQFNLAGEELSFYTANRTAVNLTRVYQGSSAGFTLLNSNINDQSLRSVVNVPMYFMADNVIGSPVAAMSTKRVSFMAIHEGLSQFDAQNFFNAVQQLRIGLGGGWV